jgi:hypothetical protein
MDSTGEIVISMDRAVRMIKDNEIKGHHVWCQKVYNVRNYLWSFRGRL